MRTQCPSCKTALSAPDSSGPQRLRCPFCATTFTAGGDDFTLSEAAPAPPVRREMLQTEKGRRPAPARNATPPSRERRTPADLRKPSPVPVGLLLGIGGGVVGFLLLMVGVVLLLVVLRSSPADAPRPVEEVAQGGGGNPVVDAAHHQGAAGPQAMPDAPPAADGNEEFIDLPERGQDLPGVAGLNPDPPGAGQPPGMPAGDLHVNLTGARITRVTRRSGGVTRSGTIIQIDYRFERGVPTRTQSFGLIVAPARGNAFKMILIPGSLGIQGTLTSGLLPTGAGGFDSPYRVSLILAAPGKPDAEETISNELTIR